MIITTDASYNNPDSQLNVPVSMPQVKLSTRRLHDNVMRILRTSLSSSGLVPPDVTP